MHVGCAIPSKNAPSGSGTLVPGPSPPPRLLHRPRPHRGSEGGATRRLPPDRWHVGARQRGPLNRTLGGDDGGVACRPCLPLVLLLPPRPPPPPPPPAGPPWGSWVEVASATVGGPAALPLAVPAGGPAVYWLRPGDRHGDDQRACRYLHQWGRLRGAGLAPIPRLPWALRPPAAALHRLGWPSSFLQALKAVRWRPLDGWDGRSVSMRWASPKGLL